MYVLLFTSTCVTLLWHWVRRKAQKEKSKTVGDVEEAAPLPHLEKKKRRAKSRNATTQLRRSIGL